MPDTDAAPAAPDAQDIPGFVQDNADLFQNAPPRWENVKDQVTQAYPDDDPADLKREYTQAWNLGAARHLANHMEENWSTQTIRHWIPAGGTAINIKQQIDYDAARRRFEAGSPTDDDYQQIALHEARQQRDAAEPWYARLAQGAVKTTGEFVMSGGASAPAAAGKAALPWLARVASSAGIHALMMPSGGAENVVQANAEAGRPALDPRGLPAGLFRAFAQQFAFEAAGGTASKLLPGAGLSKALGRTALSGIEVPILQQGADLVSYAAGAQTGYGTLQELLDGRYGDAAQGAAQQALIGALMHGVHEGQGLAGGKQTLDHFADHLRAKAKQGFSLDGAIKSYEPQGPEPGIDREGGPTPAHGAEAPFGAVPGERVPSGEQAPPEAPPSPPAPPGPAPTPEAPPAEPAGPLPEPQTAPEPSPAPPAAPGPTPAPPEAPPAGPAGPLDDWSHEDVRALAKSLGLKADGSKKTIAARLEDSMGPKTLAAVAEARRPAAPEPPAAEPPKPAPADEAPTKPGTPPSPESSAGGLSDWHKAYQEARSKGVPHDAAEKAATDAHGKQGWVHTGTEFRDTPDGTEFTGKDGKRYLIAGSMDEGRQNVEAGVIDPEKKAEVAHVLFDRKEAPPDYSSPGEAHDFTSAALRVHPDLLGHGPQEATRRSLVDALYDFAHEQTKELADRGHPMGGRIVPSESRSKGGKAVWQRNAERAAGIGPESAAPKPSLADRLKVRQTPGRPAEPSPSFEGRSTPTLDELTDLARKGRPAKLEEVMSAAGLTPQEAHVVRERLVARSHERIAGDGQMLKDDGTPYTRQRVQQVEKEALAKLGAPEGFKLSSVHADEAAGRALDMMEKGQQVSAADLHVDPEEVRTQGKARLDAIDKAQGDLDDLAEQFLKEAERGPLSADRRRHYDEESARIHAESQVQPGGEEESPPGRPEPAAGRGPGLPPPVRRAAGPGLPGGDATPGNAPADEGAGRPATAHPDRPAAPAVPEAAGSQLSPAERMRRGRAVPKEYEAKAREKGVNPDWLHQAARDVMIEDKMAVGEHNAMLQEARREQGDTGRALRLIHLERYENPDDVPGLDVVAEITMRRHPSLFDPDRENPSQTLFNLFKAGSRKPMGERAAYEQALDFLENRKEIEDAAEAARKAGHSEGALGEALRSGEEAGEAEGRSADIAPAAPGDPAGAEGSAAAHEADAIGGDDFDFGANARPGGEPVRQPGAGPGSGRPDDPIPGAVRGFVADEGGHLSPAHLAAAARMYGERLRAGYDRFQDFVDKLGGKIAPLTTRLSRRAGDAVAHFDSARQGLGAAFQAPLMTEQVAGRDAPEAFTNLVGAVRTERALRYTRYVFQQQAAQASAAAAKARAAGDQPAAAEAARQATEFMRKAQGVSTVIGQKAIPEEDIPDSPLKTFDDYRQAMADPKVQAAMGAFTQQMVPVMERNFRAAEGLDENDPIHSLTQIPDDPTNLISLKLAGRGTGARGELRSPKIGRYEFARERAGNADAYDFRLSSMIEHSLRRGNFAAEKANLYRTFEQEGVGKWVGRGEEVPEGHTLFRDVNPPKGTQAAGQDQTGFAVRDEAAGEFRQVLQADQPLQAPEAAKAAFGLLNKLSLASLVEPLTHGKNQLTMLLSRPGMSPVDFVNNALGVMRKSPEVMGRLVGLAKADALPAPQGEYQGKILPERAQLGGAYLDPTHYLSRFVETTGLAMRLTAEQAFERMARQGLAVDTEANKRNFVNQLGNYSKGSQNQLVAVLRDSGVGPFATAGGNNNVLALRSVLMNPGLEATSPAAAAQLRARMLARTVSFLAAGAVVNYLAWGRIDGDDKTPLGSIKLGTDPSGKTHYLPVANWLGLDRGMKGMGAYAFAEGARTGRPVAHSLDHAAEDQAETWLHPALGPAYQFAHTAYTGKNSLGMKVAATAKGGGSQEWENVKAALANANPPVAALGGFSQPGKSPTIPERLEGLTGPFVRSRKTAPGRDTGLIRR